MSSITLDHEEILQLTHYKRPADQLKDLHKQGFHRARIRDGELILERAHYEAVCAGRIEQARPKVKVPTVRMA